VPEAVIRQRGNRKLDTSGTSPSENLEINERSEAVNTKTPTKERAAAPTTAPTIEQQRTAYRKADALSSMKLQIGELLLFGNKQRGEFWSLFEVLLRQYWGEKA